MIVVIADDLSGAAELAGAAVRHGLTAEVQTTFASDTDAEVVCVDTDSRMLPPADASRRLAAVTQTIVAARPSWIFKKCDSVLRGPVLAEAHAVAATAGKQRILLVPANPSRGRTISDGIYRIHGQPLDKTPFASDPVHPRRAANVKALLEGDLTGVVLPDAASAGAIEFQAKAVDEATLPVGAVDFFAALLTARTRAGAIAVCHALPVGKTLLVCGSAASWEQREREAAASGIPVFSLPQGLAACSRPLRTGTSALLGIGNGVAIRDVPPEQLTRQLAQFAAAIVRETRVDKLLVEGGATAAAVIAALGWTRLRAEQVAAFGVGILRPVAPAPPLVVIKPGSYAWPAELWP
jgi:uncharacterized protein YgbK (DUF1537 family)